MLSIAAVSWNSKKQRAIAKSTTEAEYMALSMAAAEAIWLKGLELELMPIAPDLFKIYRDNKGAVDPGFRPKTKHIGIQHHFIRESVASGDIQVERLPSVEMIADILTKSLAKDASAKCASSMGLT